MKASSGSPRFLKVYQSGKFLTCRFLFIPKPGTLYFNSNAFSADFPIFLFRSLIFGYGSYKALSYFICKIDCEEFRTLSRLLFALIDKNGRMC